MTLPTPDALTVDHVLHRTAERLAERFHGIFSPETVDHYVHDAYSQLYRSAHTTTYLTAVAGHFAAERLTALAQAKGFLAKDVPEVLVVCAQNAGRSQIAAALLQRDGGDRVHVRSAGSAPAGQVDPAVVEALAEIGVSMDQAHPKPLTDDVVEAADIIITMGCGDACPLHLGKRYLDWDVPDPEGQPLSVVRQIRDDIDARVRDLLASLPTPTPSRESGHKRQG